MKATFHTASLLLCAVSTAALSAGCFQVKTESEIKPIEVKPIHITVDINVKVDKALEDFFGDLDEAETGKTTGENAAQ